MRILLLVALLLPLALLAQAAPPVPSSGAGAGGAPPLMQDLLILAYDNMMAGNYLMAEEQYRKLTLAEPNNLSAWEGLLWAENAQGKLTQSLALSAKLIRKHPGNPQFYNYRAYPLLKSKRLPEARYYYLKAYQLQPGNHVANAISQEGLADTYSGLGDYLRHRKHLNTTSALTGIPAAKAKVGFRTSIAYAAPENAKSTISLGQGICYKTWQLNIGYEDFRLNNKHFRSLSSGTLSKQFLPIDIKLGASLMEGTDARVYPAQQYGMELTPKIHVEKLLVRPAFMASYSHYPRFDLQQVSFLPEVLWRDMSFNYAYHYSYMDNEGVNTDSTRTAQQIMISKALPYNTTLGLHYGSGDNRWMVDTNGTIIDTFNEPNDYYGASVLVPFLKRWSAYIYVSNQDAHAAWYVSLTVRY
ncbi:MAG: hypothetical protein PHY48_05715 [Candidatus Cloacimonetes bacterium]|nr:hypothetical protein [Candidatus Cloacimonadota bacterium]